MYSRDGNIQCTISGVVLALTSVFSQSGHNHLNPCNHDWLGWPCASSHTATERLQHSQHLQNSQHSCSVFPYHPYSQIQISSSYSFSPRHTFCVQWHHISHSLCPIISRVTLSVSSDFKSHPTVNCCFTKWLMHTRMHPIFIFEGHLYYYYLY